MIVLTKRQAIAALIAGGLTACRSLGEMPQQSSGPPLWSARSGGRTAYLFGQVPLPSGATWFGPSVSAAFAASSELWVENPEFSREEIEALQREQAANRKMTVAEFLAPDEIARLHRTLQASGNDPSALDEVPADDAYQVLSAIAYEAAKADFANLPERGLRERAHARSLDIHTEWANLREVATFIPTAPDPIQRELIAMGIDELSSVSQSDARVHAWLSGDIHPFEQLATSFSQRYPALYALLSVRRNGRFAERLAMAMAGGADPFVCVGMLHLVGPGSIVSSLAQRGFATARVEFGNI